VIVPRSVSLPSAIVICCRCSAKPTPLIVSRCLPGGAVIENEPSLVENGIAWVQPSFRL
jgi:hypothetical protein